MCACFDGAPVVAGGDDDRVHAVHDAFVVGRGAVGISRGEGIGGDDAIAHGLAFEGFKSNGQFIDWDGTARARNSSICQIGQNPQMDFSACDGFDLRRKFFTGRVDRVRAHRIAHIIDEMNDDERANGGVFDHADFKVTCAAAEFFQDGVNRDPQWPAIRLCAHIFSASLHSY